eukprot:TRINITY_DN19849_c0_g1_i1.p1 TRINITY_DN19849_c0_g1~~TRINITY_DN19849_c0_g1_i1.p1  ORF type:complete len:187 (+),score=30.32 TRINITY_DN19849_c0_g1_i1:90-650(+)
MNGLSFSDFENSSFDSLYNRGFAGARDFDNATKNINPGNMMRALGPGFSMPGLSDSAGMPQQQLSAGSRPVYRRQVIKGPPPQQHHAIVDSQAHGSYGSQGAYGTSQPQRSLQNEPVRVRASAPAPVALNDMGVMPGNTRADHNWMPSKEAAARVQHLPTSVPALQAPPRASAPGQQGTFVGWKSN